MRRQTLLATSNATVTGVLADCTGLPTEDVEATVKFIGVVDADEFAEISDIAPDEFQFDEDKKVVQCSTLY